MGFPSKILWTLLAFVPFWASSPAFGAGSVTLSPGNLAYGNQVVGTTSAVKTVTLSNGLTKALTITSITASLAEYAWTTTCPLSPATLASKGTCTISVAFTPAALGSRADTLRVNDSATGSPQNLALSGSGVNAVTAAPTSLSFANAVVGKKSTAKTVTVTNNQSSSLTISSITADLSDYSTTTTCPLSPATLAAGKTCTASVFFTPTAAGTRNSTLTVAGNAAVNPTVSLNGMGLLAASTSPGTLTYGGQALGTSSTSQIVTLTNNQSAALRITSISTSLTDFAQTSSCPLSPSALAGGASCTVSVTFSPKAAGSRSGILTVTDNAANSPQTVSLSGTGTAATVVSIAVTPPIATIAAGLTQQFTATGTYSDGTTQDVTSIASWTSANGTTATVTASGAATGKIAGSSNITAAVGSVSGTAALTVTAPNLVSVAVTPANVTIAAGLTQQFTATGTYSDGTTQDLTSTASWTSANASIVGVNGTGLATGATLGNTTITATTGGFSAGATVTVGPAQIVSLAVTPVNPSFALGTTQQLTAIATYSDGSTLDLSGTVVWGSGSTSVVTVSSSGLASAVAAGSTTVTATAGSISGSTTVTITPPLLVAIIVTPAVPTVALGMTQQLTATGQFSDGSTQDVTATVVWSSDTLAVATISTSLGSAGLATAIAAGTAQISATSGSVSGGTRLTVGPAALVALAVAPASASVALGTTQQFSVTGTFSDGSTEDLTATATWTSDAPAVASISATGLAASLGTGTAHISASFGTLSTEATLTVTTAQVIAITVTPGTAAVAAGTTQGFTASALYSDGTTQDVTQTGHWSSSDGTVATVSDTTGSSGLATGIRTGSATINFTFNGLSGSANLTVTAASLVSIVVSPQAQNISLGATQQFTATGSYTDGSTQDITAAVSWSSSDATVAVISNATGSNGQATSAGAGTATITATLGTGTGSATLTVAANPLITLKVTPTAASIAYGGSQQFTATGTYADGSTQDLTSVVTWSAANPAVVTVGSSGLALGVGSGAGVISANFGGISSNAASVSVVATLVSIAVTPLSASVTVGHTQQFTAAGTYNDGSTQDLTNTVTWASSNVVAATVTASGLATGSAVGSSTMTATFGSVVGSATLTVTTATVTLVSIAVTPANTSTAVGLTRQFTATGTYSDGSTLNLTTTAAWISSNNLAASIASTGLATGLAQATATITATVGSVSGSTKLTVRGSTVSVTVTPASLSLTAGGTKQFKAIVSGSFNTAVSWQVNNVSGGNSIVGKVDANGNYTAPTTIPSPATVSVTATLTSDATRTGTASTTIVPVGPVSVAINPSTSQLGQGGWEQFDAIVTGSANTAVTWQVNGINGGNSTVGTVDATGLYLAPVTPPLVNVLVTALSVADPTASNSAAATISASDPLGSVINFSTYTCPTSSSNPSINGTCYKVTVSGCPEVADQDAYVKVTLPVGTPRGTVVMVAGGGAVSLYEQFTYGATAISNLVNAGFTTAQVTWATPTFQPSPIAGWLSGPGGVRRLACRFSTFAVWIKNNTSIHSGGTSEAFCGTGNSGGSSLLSYGLAHGGLASTFDMVESTSGPTNARIDYGCVCNQPHANATVGSCSYNNVNLCYGTTTAVNLLDPAYGTALCSSAVALKGASTLGPLFLADSVVAPGANYTYPKTDVHLIFGGLDPYQTVPLGLGYADQLTAAGVPPTLACVADAPHDVPSVLDGATQVSNDLITFCKKQ